ncbi:MAG: N-acetyltransferase [Alphaproteobacteria bacterium]
MFEIVPERPQDSGPREALLDLAFGPDRNGRTAYRLRDGVMPVRALSYVALVDGQFQGSLRFWPILVQGARAPLLLGPLAVEPAGRGQAIGIALVRNGLRRARVLGHDLVILVGDYAYYKRFGFVHATHLNLVMPGPVEKDRLLIRKLPRGRIIGVTGPILPALPAAQS